MEEKNKKIALSDEALDSIAGGLQICSDTVMNENPAESCLSCCGSSVCPMRFPDAG